MVMAMRAETFPTHPNINSLRTHGGMIGGSSRNMRKREHPTVKGAVIHEYEIDVTYKGKRTKRQGRETTWQPGGGGYVSVSVNDQEGTISLGGAFIHPADAPEIAKLIEEAVASMGSRPSRLQKRKAAS